MATGGHRRPPNGRPKPNLPHRRRGGGGPPAGAVVVALQPAQGGLQGQQGDGVQEARQQRRVQAALRLRRVIRRPQSRGSGSGGEGGRWLQTAGRGRGQRGDADRRAGEPRGSVSGGGGRPTALGSSSRSERKADDCDCEGHRSGDTGLAAPGSHTSDSPQPFGGGGTGPPSRLRWDRRIWPSHRAKRAYYSLGGGSGSEAANAWVVWGKA